MTRRIDMPNSHSFCFSGFRRVCASRPEFPLFQVSINGSFPSSALSIEMLAIVGRAIKFGD